MVKSCPIKVTENSWCSTCWILSYFLALGLLAYLQGRQNFLQIHNIVDIFVVKCEYIKHWAAYFLVNASHDLHLSAAGFDFWIWTVLNVISWKRTVCLSASHGGRSEHIRRLSRSVAPHASRSWPLTGCRRRWRSWTPSLPHVLLHGDHSDQSLYSQPSAVVASASLASSAPAANNVRIIIINLLPTPMLCELHWFKVPEWVRSCVLTYRGLNGTAPHYLAETIRPVSSRGTRQHLRSAETSTRLSFPDAIWQCTVLYHARPSFSADLSPCTGCYKLILLTLYGGPAAAVR